MRRCLMLFVSVCALLLTACNLSTTPPTPTPSRSVPVIEFEYPSNGSSVVEGSDLSVRLLARDETSGIVRVELLADDMIIQDSEPADAQAVPIYRVDMNWLALGTGRHTLSAIAYRADGTASDVALITLEVIPITPTAQ
jgi:Bacterial Ig domain